MTDNISIQAGEKALAVILERGLRPEDVTVVAGAAGGPKWLVLNGLDRFLFGKWFKGRAQPLYLIGSSIGAWRFAAISQSDSLAAMDRFEASYLRQTYSENPSPSEVFEEIQRLMNRYIDASSIEEILTHPYLRLNLMSDRCLGLTASDDPALQGIGLALAASANLFSRRLLRFFFKRSLFFHPHSPPLLDESRDFPLQKVPLSAENFRSALMASGSIPLVMSGIADISGASPGIYRDGGLIDYHLDLPFPGEAHDIVLFPHYSERIIPGWFDKKLTWRRPSPRHMTRVLLIAPSQHFVERLPYHKIADRNDFFLFKGRSRERCDYWRRVVDSSRILAEELAELIDSGRIARVVKPL